MYFPKSGIELPLLLDPILKGLWYEEAALSDRTAVVLRARTAGTAGLAAERKHSLDAEARDAIVRRGARCVATEWREIQEV